MLQEAAQSLSSSQQRRGRQKYTARVHVYDIAATVCASMQQPRPGAVYNIVDDDPAPRGEVMAYTRALLQAQMGQQQEPNQLSLQPSTAAETHEPLPAAQAADLKTCSATAADSNSPAPVSDAAADAAAGEQSPEPFVSPTPQARGRRSGGEVLDEKRVRNALIKTELGMQLRYPTYRCACQPAVTPSLTALHVKALGHVQAGTGQRLFRTGALDAQPRAARRAYCQRQACGLQLSKQWSSP